MKRLFLLLFSAVLLLAPAAYTTLSAQRLQDGSYSTVGYIKSDGTIQNGSYSTIGHIKSDGTVQDGSYRTIGHIKSDGTVQDGSYRTIGHFEKGMRTDWVAWFFFFHKQ